MPIKSTENFLLPLVVKISKKCKMKNCIHENNNNSIPLNTLIYLFFEPTFWSTGKKLRCIKILTLVVTDTILIIITRLQYIGTLQRKIEKFENTVSWINKEEGLFNKTISTFPEFDDVKVHWIKL